MYYKTVYCFEYLLPKRSICSFFSIYLYLKSQHISGLFVYNPCHRSVAFESDCKSAAITYWQCYSSLRKSASFPLYAFLGSIILFLYYAPLPNVHIRKAVFSIVCHPLAIFYVHISSFPILLDKERYLRKQHIFSRV